MRNPFVARTFSERELSCGLAVVSSVVLAVFLFATNELYLAVLWKEYGFTACGFEPFRLLAVVALSAIVSYAMPTTIEKPGDLLCAIFHTLLVVPSIAIVLAQRNASWGHGLIVISMSLGFVSLAWANAKSGRPSNSRIDVMPLALASLAVSVILILAVTYTQWNVMRFVGIGDTYEQRSAGKATSLFIAYSHTYLANVFCPILFAFGLVKRRYWMFSIVGLVGFIVIYSITAQKQSLAIPIAMAALLFGFSIGLARHFCTFVVLAVCLVSYSLCEFFIVQDYSIGPTLVLHRTFGIPALTLSQYYDFFSENGFTFWSHVRGISLFVSPPPALGQNSLWPGLGYLMGQHTLGRSDVNINASLFASDGAGAGGAIGVFVISLALACWTAAINRLAQGVDDKFMLLAVFPVIVCLISAPFFTVMLSFGGLFWIVALASLRWKRPLIDGPIDTQVR